VLDRLVGEAQHLVSSLSQERFSLRVVVSLDRVNVSIKLNSQAPVWTAEINHEGANGMLASKLQTCEAAIA
jgi:hypothetical protein